MPASNTKIDYEGIIEFYHNLNKTRDLLPHEIERLDDIIKKMNWANAQRKYREKNKALLDEKRRIYAKKNRSKENTRMRNWRSEHPHNNKEHCRKYRLSVLQRSNENADIDVG